MSYLVTATEDHYQIGDLVTTYAIISTHEYQTLTRALIRAAIEVGKYEDRGFGLAWTASGIRASIFHLTPAEPGTGLLSVDIAIRDQSVVDRPNLGPLSIDELAEYQKLTRGERP